MKIKALQSRYIYIFLILFIFIIPAVSAGFFDFFKDSYNSITGKATSDTTTLSIAIGNAAPAIDSVSSISDQSVTESATTAVAFSFIASDTDGSGNLDDATAKGCFNRTGQATRCSSCSEESVVDATTVNYTCSIDMWYWDGPGSWTINVSIKDINSEYAEDTSTTFTLLPTTAMVMSPTALTWPAISLISTNQSSNNDPIIINNTANKDITDGNVEVTAINLQGGETTTDYLLAANFTVNTADNCEGTVMVNGTATGVSGATITAGNNSNGDGKEELYFCLNEVTAGISQQTYSTAGDDTGAWTIGVT